MLCLLITVSFVLFLLIYYPVIVLKKDPMISPVEPESQLHLEGGNETTFGEGTGKVDAAELGRGGEVSKIE